jgi:ribonuclease HI
MDGTLKWWMLDALQAMKENAARAFLTTLYEIWEVRNAVVHEDILNSPASVARKIHYLIQECENLHQPTAQTCPRPSVRWSKPPRGWIKANSDGALNMEKRIGGCGAILRNHDGNVVVARSSKVDNVMDVETVELLACRQALVLAEELRIPKIMLEMDNANAVSKIKGVELDRSATGSLVQELKNRLARFQEVVVKHAHRSSNGAADLLAKHGCSSKVEKTWCDVVPEFLHPVLCKDLCSNE